MSDRFAPLDWTSSEGEASDDGGAAPAAAAGGGGSDPCFSDLALGLDDEDEYRPGRGEVWGAGGPYNTKQAMQTFLAQYWVKRKIARYMDPVENQTQRLQRQYTWAAEQDKRDKRAGRRVPFEWGWTNAVSTMREANTHMPSDSQQTVMMSAYQHFLCNRYEDNKGSTTPLPSLKRAAVYSVLVFIELLMNNANGRHDVLDIRRPSTGNT